MTSLNTLLPMLTVVITLYIAQLIAEQIPDNVTSNEKYTPNKNLSIQDESIGNVPKASVKKRIRSLSNSAEKKTNFWNNIIPFYTTIKSLGRGRTNVMMPRNSSVSATSTFGGWLNNVPDDGSVKVSEQAYPKNHVIDSYDFQNSDDRQDYEDAPETYNGIPESTYPDNYYNDAELPPTVTSTPYPIAFLRGPHLQPPPYKSQTCNCRPTKQVIIPKDVRQLVPDGQGGFCGIGTGMLNVLGALGTNIINLWTLMIPVLLPLMAFKIILLAFKLYKIFKVVKFLLKLFILLPFFIRVVYPAITNFIDNQQSVVNHLRLRTNEDTAVGRNSFSLWKLDEFMNDTEVRTCTSKSACEFGVFLAEATSDYVPEKVTKFFETRAEKAEERGKMGDEENPMDQIYSAFIIALGKKWSYERCAVFLCNFTF